MSMPIYDFADEPINQSRSRRSGRNRSSTSRSGSGSQRHPTHITTESGSNLQSVLSQHGTRNDTENIDGNGSLTYSASSSVNSQSTAGNSSDSSFGHIIDVLDLNDDLDRLISKGDDGVLSPQQRELLKEHSVQQQLSAQQREKLLVERRVQQKQRERREMQSYNGHRHHKKESSDDSGWETTNIPPEFFKPPIPSPQNANRAYDEFGFPIDNDPFVAPTTNINNTNSSINSTRQNPQKINSSRTQIRHHQSHTSTTRVSSTTTGGHGSRPRSEMNTGMGPSRQPSPLGSSSGRASTRFIDNDPREVLAAFSTAPSPSHRGTSRRMEKRLSQQQQEHDWRPQW
mmetsp:Transcript_1011/g.1314  ORF Transcript_1011/g.1314 Transcript_1011/m.1314 type:complete len:343 (+) Transcript_1011:192-1220(+)|eukprot:CAMPEP_0172498458 /NCGR_PEP_ID=MMETSP1066-20121228/113446_1 /TAXON_ID=671091 /ORGANISM="Coscinodiscus wailesii, Strain CCMP2513" /LENGTH=342 /DNA_ID=CAMNT_0013271737 /DNA_START=129 /DNA_END=1154 /DNA_ORIENTATION=-